jgi:hypothetical protein
MTLMDREDKALREAAQRRKEEEARAAFEKAERETLIKQKVREAEGGLSSLHTLMPSGR